MDEKNTISLQYSRNSAAFPLSADENQLQTVTAEPWLEISKEALQLEGLCFDREGNLYLLEVFGGRVFKVSLPEKTIETVFGENTMNPAAIKIHKDGRLFLCVLGDLNSSIGSGGVYAIQPDGSNMEEIIAPREKYAVDDMVFDRKGGFYFTDFRGHHFDPLGGVYYVSPDFNSVTPIAKNLASPNGISLSKDEKSLWITETNANRLNRIELLDDGVTIAPYGSSVPYYFSGYDGPDSCCIDTDDNLYVAMYEQGRVLVFNKNGCPIGQILLPGRENGHMLRSTHPAFIPETNELIICSNDPVGGGGSWLFRAKGFAKGHLGYQFA